MDVEKWLKDYNQPPPRPTTKNAIRDIDRYDRQDLAAMAEQINRFGMARLKLAETTDTAGPLSDDTAMSFFKVQPELEAAASMDARYLINLAVAAELQGTSEWERLRAWTEGDIINTAMAFVDVEPLLERLFDKRSKEAAERKAQDVEARREELAQAQQEAANLDELIERWSEQFEPGSDELAGAEDAAGALQAAIEALEAAVGSAEKDLTKSATVAVKAALGPIKEAMAEAADAAELVATMTRGFGLEPGDLQRMDANTRIALAKRLNGNEKFQRLAEMIGPMMRLASMEQTRKVYHSNQEVYNVTLGKDLNRVLPSEMLNLVRTDTKYIFYKNWSEGRLLEYAMRGNERVGKGGIILCMDNSASMNGDPEIWAKAVGGATFAIAREQKRSFHGIHFSSRSEIKLFDFSDPTQVSLDQMIEYFEHFFNGGTNFQVPLAEALKILQAEERAKGVISGDILFVTDGRSAVTGAFMEEFNAERERLGFKVWGILITDNDADKEAEPLRSICDGNIVTIQDLLSGSQVRDMFREL
jgi:uncharacterized protein with von Willebrand factor type A (vWA) domain